MSKPWILVSPASRGIGHALTRHLLRTTTAPVLATARSDLPGVRASLLDSLRASENCSKEKIESASQRLHLLHVDVTDESTLTSASAEAAKLFPPKTHHLHLAFALPGILRAEKSPRDIDYDAAQHMLRTNVLGPLMLMKHFGEFLPRKSAEPRFSASEEGGEENFKGLSYPNHATWLTASARVGSISDNKLGGWYTYRASKAAVNSATRTFDRYLRTRSGDAAVAIAYHPGTVRTDLSKDYWDRVRADRLFSPKYAAERVVEVVRSRKIEHRGRCWDWNGEEILP
ncbi:NAD(P)-binding protein [Hypomontagnella submonticulosa]|nr:NAD(P)-binding protein [Hypomontagnella submonticulosa]